MTDTALTSGQIDGTEDVDYWPTPDAPTYEKAARASILAAGLELTDEEAEKVVAAALAEPAFLAIVHAVWADRLPTPDAYYRTCRAMDSHRERADRAEALLEKVRDYVGDDGDGEIDVWSLREVLAGREVGI